MVFFPLFCLTIFLSPFRLHIFPNRSRVWSVYDAQLKVNWTCFHCLNNLVHMGGSISSSTRKDCRTWWSWEEEHHHHLFLKLNVSFKQKCGTLYLYQGLLLELCSQVLGYYHFKWTPYRSGCILCVLLLLQGAIWFSLKMITLSHSKSPFFVGFFVFVCMGPRICLFLFFCATPGFHAQLEYS